MLGIGKKPGRHDIRPMLCCAYSYIQSQVSPSALVLSARTVTFHMPEALMLVSEERSHAISLAWKDNVVSSRAHCRSRENSAQ